jgi:hypothetical protein
MGNLQTFSGAAAGSGVIKVTPFWKGETFFYDMKSLIKMALQLSKKINS